jgi:hypothetical protein
VIWWEFENEAQYLAKAVLAVQVLPTHGNPEERGQDRRQNETIQFIGEWCKVRGAESKDKGEPIKTSKKGLGDCRLVDCHRGKEVSVEAESGAERLKKTSSGTASNLRHTCDS